MMTGFARLISISLIIAVTQATAAERVCDKAQSSPLPAVLQPPPCPECPETAAELKELQEIQVSRTEDQAKQALADEKRSVKRFLEGAGISVDEAKLERCQEFFIKRRDDERAAVAAAKATFCRPRPYDKPDNGLIAISGSTREQGFSYPSGHAAYGALIGSLLAEMIPEKRREIYERIKSYARSRMIMGAHYRSDVEAGKLLGAVLAASLLAKDEFKPALADAKSCVRQAIGLN